MLHKFTPPSGFVGKGASCSNSSFIPVAPSRHMYGPMLWEEWRQRYGIADKFPRWGVFSKEWQQMACQIAALKKAEKAPIPPEPKEN